MLNMSHALIRLSERMNWDKKLILMLFTVVARVSRHCRRAY
jgi:hypothetical protein